MESQTLQTHQILEEQETCTAMGVVIVTYNSGDVITDCLDSLLNCGHPDLRIVICDNNSPDDTVEIIHHWAQTRACDFVDVVMNEATPPQLESLGRMTLLHSPLNAGFASGVNAGLRALLAESEIDLFWVLNPDCVVTKGAAQAYAKTAAASGPFSLMGGRTLYLEPPNYIQSDGGRVNHWTGVCSNANYGLDPDTVEMPDPATLDHIPGANVVASRVFVETAGLMTEDFFLYYEEIDWAARRGDLPLKLCSEAVVYHHGGTATGSALPNQRASAFTNYFNYRNRIIFMRRHFPTALPVSYIYSVLKIFKLAMLGAWEEAYGAVCGLFQLPPPKGVRDRLSEAAATRAFGKGRETQ